MKDEILDKLRKFLNKNTLSNECEVVYFLVQIRKILDHLGTKAYPILKFYCDWSVHIEKDYIKPIQDVMEKIEQDINNKGKSDNLSSFNFISLSELRKQMQAFFKQVALPENIFQDNNWLQFKQLLLGVLANQPLKNPTKNISKVYFPITSGNKIVLLAEFKGRLYRFIN